MNNDVYENQYLSIGTRVRILKRKYALKPERFYGRTGTVTGVHTYVGTDTFFNVHLDEPVIEHIVGYGDIELDTVDVHKYDITKEGIEILDERNEFVLTIPD